MGIEFGINKQNENLPEKNHEQVYFDPRVELKKVRELNDDEKLLPKEEILKLRKERLSVFKKNLADQMMASAKINADLEDMFFSDADISLEKMQNYFKEAALASKLAPWQIETYNIAIKKLIERKISVDNFFTDNCENKTGEEIFEYIFEKKPHGKISVKKGSLCPIIVCDEKDFSYLYSMGDLGNAVITNQEKDDTLEAKNLFAFNTFLDTKKSNKFANFGSALIAIKETLNDSSKIAQLIAHENKHAFDQLVFSKERDGYFKSISAYEEKIKKLRDYMEHISDEELNNLSEEEYMQIFLINPIEIRVAAMQEASEAIAKNEILAFFKQGADPELIYELLASSDQGYSIMDDQTERVERNNFENMEETSQENTMIVELYEKMHAQRKEKYRKHLDAAITAIKYLEKNRVPKNEIIGLFETEPLANWNKIFERIKKSDKYKNLK